ncbi:pro-resilin-like [Colias croceus]|uniref:pro-resilin-like n=1 Tax=Colias crocea TaxID=72248 RepID=UPI001E281208|nr:pro-resilin-like [Colias croceus]
MKVFIVVAIFVMAAVAEPPISKSYLPPPSSKSGYSQGPASFQAGGPQVIAARNLENAHGHGFARNNPERPGARFAVGHEHGYDNGIARDAFEASSEPANYNFGYMVNDFNEGTDFGHHEERQEETARGEYHVVLPDGRKQTVSYKADERGFKPQISYEETEDLTRGYDANANSRGNHDNGYHGGSGHHENSFGNHGNGFNGGLSNHGNARSGY